MQETMIDKASGSLLILLTVLVILGEWTGGPVFYGLAAAGVVVILALLFTRVRWSRQIFVVVGLALFAGAVLTRPDWADLTVTALGRAAFIAAFFTALATLRNASETSSAILRSGRFLAQQPPGRRYAALTVGGHLFGLLLTYGALGLLGGMAAANAQQEPNAEIRTHRLRRMLLAIQRGFVSTLPWSPLSLAIAISTSLVPGAPWSQAVWPCLVTAAILAITGWALDTIFKPRLTAPAPVRTKPDGTWAVMLPLVLLLGIFGVLVGGLHALTGIRAAGVVMAVVPAIALVWIVIQHLGQGKVKGAVGQVQTYVTRHLPGYRSELVLLMMAGFIGAMGTVVLAPLVAASGLDLSAVPGWAILVALVWVIPVTGQLGMNPILSVSLIVPLLPDAATMGVDPVDIIVGLTAGWSLCGASSPYTATTMMIGSLGRVSAFHVGMRWNGVYTLVCAVLMSFWVAFVALT